jgi:hypothetical protein
MEGEASMEASDQPLEVWQPIVTASLYDRFESWLETKLSIKDAHRRPSWWEKFGLFLKRKTPDARKLFFSTEINRSFFYFHVLFSPLVLMSIIRTV